MRTIVLLAVALVCLGQEPEDAGEATPIPILKQSIVITASPVEIAIERRDDEVFRRTLFTRDDHVFHLMDAGVNAGQHEGGGKSVELRRFGYNLDHGGIGGGLRVLVDNVVQNQSTQGHGQGYLGTLKSLSPELIEEVTLVNGPFSAEHGDFSGLGVVHVRLRDAMPDVLTARLQGGSFGTVRGFLAFSPQLNGRHLLVAYEGAHSDGPFVRPLDYRRDNLSINYGFHPTEKTSYALRFNGGLNRFDSSGQLPLDEVAAGRLDRFGVLSEGDGGDAWNGTLAGYMKRDLGGDSMLKTDGYVSRSLLDLYANFTFFLSDPVNGDAFVQHDSRLQQGANVQYVRPKRHGGVQTLLTTGANFHANQINVGLSQRVHRDPIAAFTSAHADVSNGGVYAQEQVSLFGSRLQLGGGLRYDVFRFDVQDRLEPHLSGWDTAGELQPKFSTAWRPSLRAPVTLHANYGRGISSLDARGVVRSPGDRHVSTTDFVQSGVTTALRRVSLAASLFRIARSNELVYIADDGSMEFRGPSLSYGYETRTGVELTRRLALHGGLTRVTNAYYRGTDPRVYVDTAPHLVANASLTLSGWRGWSGSLRMRAINGYRLDGEDASIGAAGHTVWDFAVARPITRAVELSLVVDNLLDREYYEMQNYFESRLPGQDARSRIHGTPGYPRTVLLGMTVRFGGK